MDEKQGCGGFLISVGSCTLEIARTVLRGAYFNC